MFNRKPAAPAYPQHALSWHRWQVAPHDKQTEQQVAHLRQNIILSIHKATHVQFTLLISGQCETHICVYVHMIMFVQAW